jgi:hypothetical protein
MTKLGILHLLSLNEEFDVDQDEKHHRFLSSLQDLLFPLSCLDAVILPAQGGGRQVDPG